MSNDTGELDKPDATNGDKQLASVRAFGLKAAIVFVCTTPHFLYGLKFWAAAAHVPFEMPETTILTVCLGGVGAIIAFGYKTGRK